MSPPLRFPVSIHEFKAWQRRVDELERQGKTNAEWQKTAGEDIEGLRTELAAVSGKLDLLLQATHHAPIKAGVWGGGLGSALYLLERLIDLLTRHGG